MTHTARRNAALARTVWSVMFVVAVLTIAWAFPRGADAQCSGPSCTPKSPFQLLQPPTQEKAHCAWLQQDRVEKHCAVNPAHDPKFKEDLIPDECNKGPNPAAYQKGDQLVEHIRQEIKQKANAKNVVFRNISGEEKELCDPSAKTGTVFEGQQFPGSGQPQAASGGGNGGGGGGLAQLLPALMQALQGIGQGGGGGGQQPGGQQGGGGQPSGGGGGQPSGGGGGGQPSGGARQPSRSFDDEDDDTGTSVTCPTTYAPVCGADGRTYANRCSAEEEFGVSVQRQGKCGSSGGTAPTPSPELLDDLLTSFTESGIPNTLLEAIIRAVVGFVADFLETGALPASP